MNDLNKLFLLIRFQWIRIIRQSKMLLSILMIFFLITNIFLLIRSASDRPLPTLALIIEDNSVEVKTFVNNITDNRLKNILSFKQMSLSEALRAVKEREVLGAFHIHEGIFSALDQGKRQTLTLYLSDENDPVSRFLIRYVDNLTQVLNEAQAGAMIYLEQMHLAKLSAAEIQNRFAKIQLQYVSAFLSRSAVFSDSPAVDSFFGLSFLSYYFFAAILLLAFFFTFAMLTSFREDLLSERFERLLMSGYSRLQLYTSLLIALSIPNTIFLTEAKLSAPLFTKTPLSSENDLFLIPTMLLLSLMIVSLSLVLMRYTAASRFFDWFYGLFLLISALSGGLLLPLPAMGRIFTNLAPLHPIAVAHRLLSGAPMTVFSFTVLFGTFLLLISLLWLKERRYS